MSETRSPEESQSSETYFTNADGQKIFCKYWADQKPQNYRAIVFITHGAAEHCLCYDSLADRFIKAGFFVFAHDHVGHGQSDGSRMHIDDFNIYIRDVFQHIDLIKEKHQDMPIFIVGHSMGGAIAVLAAMQRPKYFTGVVLISPAIAIHPSELNPCLITIGRAIAWIFPQFPVKPCLNLATISRNTALVEKLRADPLRWHGSVKAKWGLCLLKATQQISDQNNDVDWPFLCLHGDADGLCDVEGSKTFSHCAKSADKTLKIYEGFYHQLHNEPDEDGEGVCNEIVEWITQRIK